MQTKIYWKELSADCKVKLKGHNYYFNNHQVFWWIGEDYYARKFLAQRVDDTHKNNHKNHLTGKHKTVTLSA